MDDNSEPYQKSLFEPLMPIFEDYRLCQEKIEQVRSKRARLRNTESFLLPFYRRLQYLQEWINISIDNHAQRIFFEDVLRTCGISLHKFSRENCIYDDFEGYCACREEDWVKWGRK